MKRLLAIVTAMVLISAPLAYAGPRGGGGRSSFGSGKSFQQPAQPRTGTVKDLGVSPSSKSPIDSVKKPTTTSPTAASPAPAQQAPAPTAGFFGGGGFGSSWMNWAIIGYLFGRSTSRPEEVKSKEKDKEKEQLKQKEQVKDGSDPTAKEQLKDEKPTTQSKSPLELR